MLHPEGQLGHLQGAAPVRGLKVFSRGSSTHKSPCWGRVGVPAEGVEWEMTTACTRGNPCAQPQLWGSPGTALLLCRIGT